MQFSIEFYTNKKGGKPVEKFLRKIRQKNKTLWAQTIKGLEKIKNKQYHIAKNTKRRNKNSPEIFKRLSRKEKASMKKTNFDKYIEAELKKHPSLKKEFEKADRAWDIALQLIALREKRNLTQKKLARLVGTSQSNIARLENADYQGYNLKTLEKVARALKARLDITFVPIEKRAAKPELKPAFL